MNAHYKAILEEYALWYDTLGYNAKTRKRYTGIMTQFFDWLEGKNINHQYSKSYEFECDFNGYISRYFTTNIKYFSILRPISEFQITKQLVKYDKYLKIFRSCNLRNERK